MKQSVISILIVVLILFFWSLMPVVDPDLGWHLRTGEDIINHLQIPRVDTYSFSLPGHPLVIHSWLQDIFIFSFYKFFGMIGISLWYAFWVVATGMLLLRPKRLDWKLLIGVVVLGFGINFIGLRPHLVTLFGLSLIYWWVGNLETMKSNSNKVFDFLIQSKAYFLIGFFLLWANIHAGVVVGELFLGLMLTIYFGFKLFNKTFNKTEFIFSLLVLVACVGVTLINPYGFGLYEFVTNLASNSATLATNQDWLPLLSSRFPSDTFLSRTLLIILSVLAFLVAIKPKDKLIIVLVFLLTLMSIRFSLILFVVLVPVLSSGMSSYIAQFLGKANLAKVGFLVMIILVSRVNSINDWKCSLQISCYAKLIRIPTELVDQLNQLPNDSKVLNDYNLGGFLIWQQQERKVFIDGRMDGFEYNEKSFIEIYRQLYEADANYQNLLSDFEIEYLLLPKNSEIFMDLDRQNKLDVIDEEEEYLLAKLIR